MIVRPRAWKFVFSATSFRRASDNPSKSADSKEKALSRTTGPFPTSSCASAQLRSAAAERFRERLHAGLVDSRRLGGIGIELSGQLLELVGRALAVLAQRVAHGFYPRGVDALRAAQLIHVGLGDDGRRFPHDL